MSKQVGSWIREPPAATGGQPNLAPATGNRCGAHLDQGQVTV
jgi:hypothetical protein